MSKFRKGDIIIGSKPGHWRDPIIILDDHVFPSGTLAYRFRVVIPGYDDYDGSEIWPTDGYIDQSYLDEFTLLWRMFSGN